MKQQLILLILLLTLFVSCGSISAQKETSTQEKTNTCIQQKIEEYKKQPVTNPPMSIYQYTYNGKTVYFVSAPCCDRYSILYDSECTIICHPSGGITGAGDGKCNDFFEKRTDEKLRWKDDRKP